MPKKIAIQNDLNNLKNDLISLGYEIGDVNDESLDAILYEADGYDIAYHDLITSMTNEEGTQNRSGTLLINVTGKSLEEIDYIINHRTYSPLF